MNDNKTIVVGTRMPEVVRDLLRKIAQREDRSVSWLILKCIRTALPKIEANRRKGIS
jgi:hypothetical protein